jgi:hypothetical protein
MNSESILTLGLVRDSSTIVEPDTYGGPPSSASELRNKVMEILNIQFSLSSGAYDADSVSDLTSSVHYLVDEIIAEYGDWDDFYSAVVNLPS